MSETTAEQIEKSPYKNVYWFARHLMNTDQFGALGKAREKQLLKITVILETILIQDNLSDSEKVTVCKSTFFGELRKTGKPNTKSAKSVDNFIDIMDRELSSTDDIAVFCITMKYVIAPINHALTTVPSNDREFCRQTVASILQALGEEKAGIAISTWDTLGVKGCLTAERVAVTEAFTALIHNIQSIQIPPHSAFDDSLIMTAFVQEFERRLGQKRKSRGGSSLEDVVDFLFSFYKFPSSEAPSHFDNDLEVDKWFRCKDGWNIGISCKRTLRERWKQVSQADRGTLSHFKIRELWHIITYDRDLSDDKIVRLGEQNQIFYLMDNSEIYARCSAHPGMQNYVRPLSQFIKDIRNNIK